MNVVLWIIQGLLVLVFGFSALVKGTQSKARALALGMTGVANLPTSVMRFTAFCELLAIIGLGEPQTAAGNLILLALCVIVAVGRWPGNS
jgi:hypothetical protein